MGISILFFIFNFKELTVKDILNFTPSNYFIACLVMIFIFALKSIIMVIPLTVLYISSSVLFPGAWGIIVNLIGLIICMTIPYFIGKFSGKKLVDKLISKYPKINKINEIKSNNEWTFIFTVKVLGFIPNEVSSIILGSLDTKYRLFILSSVLAKTPSMIATTLLGANINKPGTSGFAVSIAIAILAFAFVAYMFWKNKNIIKS